MATTGARKPGLRSALAALWVPALGLLVWFAVVLFEEFVTADLRWGLWFGAAALFGLGLLLARRGFGWWAPLVAAAPLVLLYGRLVVRGLPALWPHPALWLASAVAGWVVLRRKGAVAPAVAVLLGALLFLHGAWNVPRVLSEAINRYVDEPAPAFALQHLDGSPYSARDMDGKVVVLDFFSTWCPPCIAELPEIARVREAFADRDDVVILVVGDGDGGDTPEQVATFARDRGLGLEFVYDPGGVAHDAFGFVNVPALAVLDRRGHVRLRRVGFNVAETGFPADLIALIERLVAADSGEPAQAVSK